MHFYVLCIWSSLFIMHSLYGTMCRFNFWGMEIKESIYFSQFFSECFHTHKMFFKSFNFGFGAYQHFMLFRHLVESLKIFFVFLLQHFFHWAECCLLVVLPRYSVQLLAVCFILLKQYFPLMHGTDFCAS